MAGLGGDSSCLVGSMAPQRSSVRQGVKWKVPRAAPPSVNYSETRCPLEGEPPTLEPAVVTAFAAGGWTLLPPRWPGLRNGVPGAGLRFAH